MADPPRPWASAAPAPSPFSGGMHLSVTVDGLSVCSTDSWQAESQPPSPLRSRPSPVRTLTLGKHLSRPGTATSVVSSTAGGVPRISARPRSPHRIEIGGQPMQRVPRGVVGPTRPSTPGSPARSRPASPSRLHRAHRSSGLRISEDPLATMAKMSAENEIQLAEKRIALVIAQYEEKEVAIVDKRRRENAQRAAIRKAASDEGWTYDEAIFGADLPELDGPEASGMMETLKEEMAIALVDYRAVCDQREGLLSGIRGATLPSMPEAELFDVLSKFDEEGATAELEDAEVAMAAADGLGSELVNDKRKRDATLGSLIRRAHQEEVAAYRVKLSELGDSEATIARLGKELLEAQRGAAEARVAVGEIAAGEVE
ncbi:hypothetical protein T492DRAFT_875314, partial [Pavlovales sp. CCMP2436]